MSILLFLLGSEDDAVSELFIVLSAIAFQLYRARFKSLVALQWTTVWYSQPNSWWIFLQLIKPLGVLSQVSVATSVGPRTGITRVLRIRIEGHNHRIM